MIRFRTETGSLYEIDLEKKTWARLEEPKEVGGFALRTKEGRFHEITPIEIGKSVEFTGDPINPAADFRYVCTSHVVEILT